jgi:PAS domain S-box-containing protein
MLTHPLTLASLLGLAVALAWTALQPGIVPVALAAGCAALLVGSLRRQAGEQWQALQKRLTQLERSAAEQRSALEHAESARAASEAALHATEQRCLLALRGSQDGMWEWDIGSGRVLLSPRWKSMLGLEVSALGDDKAGWFSRVHPDDRPALERALAEQLQDGDARFDLELRLLHNDGSVRWVLSRAVALRHASGAPYRVVGQDTDVTRLKHVQMVLDAVAEGTSGAFGERFFPAMVQHFARALEVDCAFVTECADQPPTRLRTLAMWSANGYEPNFEYPLAGTPCEEVVNGRRTCFHPSGVGLLFPIEASYEAYLGLPIVASDGRVLGHLAFLDKRVRGNEMLVDSVYRIFLARAGAELERIQALAQLSALSANPHDRPHAIGL